MFPGENLPQVKSPLDKNDHPKLDNSELSQQIHVHGWPTPMGSYPW